MGLHETTHLKFLEPSETWQILHEYWVSAEDLRIDAISDYKVSRLRSSDRIIPMAHMPSRVILYKSHTKSIPTDTMGDFKTQSNTVTPLTAGRCG